MHDDEPFVIVLSEGAAHSLGVLLVSQVISSHSALHPALEALAHALDPYGVLSPR